MISSSFMDLTSLHSQSDSAHSLVKSFKQKWWIELIIPDRRFNLNCFNRLLQSKRGQGHMTCESKGRWVIFFSVHAHKVIVSRDVRKKLEWTNLPIIMLFQKTVAFWKTSHWLETHTVVPFLKGIRKTC